MCGIRYYMSKNEILAYIAGLCDGEAYIGIKKAKAYKHLSGRVNDAYHERIQVRMVDEAAIRFLAENLGGWYYREKASCAKGRPLFCYQASDAAAVAIIKQLIPFLRVKKEVANTVLNLRRIKDCPDYTSFMVEVKNRWGKSAMVSRRRYSQAMIQDCNTLWQKCKTLNKVGI